MKEIKPRRTGKGGITLEFMIKGERYAFAPVINGKFDNTLDYGDACSVARQIARDLHADKFDTTLSNYKPETPEKKEAKRLSLNYDLSMLWSQYTEARRNHVSESTLSIGYAQITRLLNEADSTQLIDAQNLKLWILNNKPPTYAKKLLMQLNACCKWGVELKLINDNPFQGYLKLLNKKTSVTETDIDPFDEAERKVIIDIFANSKRLNHYRGLVEFLFSVGCRPSEAIALTWEDVERNKIVFNKTFVNGVLSNRLKTEEKRVVNQNKTVQLILFNQKKYLIEQELLDSGLVFPASKGKGYVDWHNFSTKFWKKTLFSNETIRYRTPYQMRHSFITSMLKAGVSPQDIAKHCGNSADVIFRHYAGVSRGFTMPEI